MSRKGVAVPSGSKSKKIPRIFQRRQTCSPTRFPYSSSPSTSTSTSTDLIIPAVSVSISNEQTYSYQSIQSTTGITDGKNKWKKKSNKQYKTNQFNNIKPLSTTTTNNNNFYAINNKITCIEKISDDVETVANIEKWLKTRTESISSMDLDTIKSEVEGASGDDNRYLEDEELPHAFLGKNPDVLSMDIDLSDKKLTLGYDDPLLQDLRGDKLLEACEKDEFILPSFQLDNLDSLTLTPDDMMVAGEILPSANSHAALNNSAIFLDSTNILNEEEINCKKNHRNYEKETREKGQRSNSSCVDQRKDLEDSSKRILNVYVEAVGHVDVETSPVDTLAANVLDTDETDERDDELRPKLKTKLEPRIIKKRRKNLPRIDNNGSSSSSSSFRVIKNEEQSRNNEGIMAVVAISTDKISNMTQIVINTGKEEQIYQGKTSELIEATGNFPQLSRIQNSCDDNEGGDLIADCTNNSEHDLVLSNALEELGITDDNLEPISSNEHGKIWICPKDDCRRQFNRLYALKGHVLSHYGVRPFKCDFKGCAWAFYSEFKLKRHKETHLKRKDYVCEVEDCGRRFTTIYNLLTHKKLHNRPSKIICHVPNCQERFQTKRALELHMRSHDQSHAPYVCKHEGCGKRYYSSNALTSHQRCHSYKESDIKCSWPGCGKLFDKPCRLKAHIRSHTGYKPYLCTFQGCNWAFSSSSKLKRHQKKHTNDRKFVCDVTSCGKAFMRSEHLKEHRLTHKDRSYFQCHMCDAKFSAKSSLYVHIKKHQTQEAVASLQNSTLILQESDTAADQQVYVAANDDFESNVQNSDISQEQDLDLDLDLDPVVVDAPLAIANQNIHHQDSMKMAYHCPMETCTKVYAAKSTLRAHMLRIHGTKNGDQKIFNSNISQGCISTSSSSDYVGYSTSPVSQSTDHMIMIAPHESLVVSSPELESPSFNSILKLSESGEQNSVQCLEDCGEERGDEINEEGCARTDLTYNDFLRLFKSNSTIFNSVVGATDVVLGAAGLVEGLLLPDDLPSVYYQDDITGTECQVLLLDSGHHESTINLRDLE